MVESYFIPDISKPLHPGEPMHGWKEGIFVTSSTATPYFISKATKEKAIVVGTTGLNTFHLMNPHEIQTLNNAGISVIWAALPKPKRGIDVNDVARQVVREFFTSPSSPAHRMFATSAPRFLATHSTSGRILLELLHDDQTAKKLRHHFSGAVYVAPYLDTANGSRMHNPTMDAIFQAFAQRYSDYTPHETLFGRTYMAIKASTEGFRLSGKKPPQSDETSAETGIHKALLKKIQQYLASPKHDTEMTYGQILHLQNAGRKLMDKFNPSAAGAIPSIFLIGDNDPFACHRTSEHFARLMGADIITAKGAGHYPMKDAPDLLGDFIRRVDVCVRERSKIEYITPQEFWAMQSAPPITQESKDNRFLGGFRGALESITGRLNPAAGVLQ